MAAEIATVPGSARVHIRAATLAPGPNDIVLCDIEVDQPAVNTDADIDVEAEAALHLLAQHRHLAGNVEAGLHCAVRVVLMSNRMAEDREQAVALC